MSSDLLHALREAQTHESECRAARNRALADCCDAMAEARAAQSYVGKACESGHYADGVAEELKRRDHEVAVTDAAHRLAIVQVRRAFKALREGANGTR